jgi:hypothetical protein
VLEDRWLPSTLVVTDPGDSGPNTLRGRIAAANPAGGDTITFASGISQIKLTSGGLTLDRNLTITGPGSAALTVGRDPNVVTTFGVFVVNSGVTATVSGLTVVGGDTSSGGGFSNGGTLGLTDVVQRLPQQCLRGRPLQHGGPDPHPVYRLRRRGDRGPYPGPEPNPEFSGRAGRRPLQLRRHGAG